MTFHFTYNYPQVARDSGFKLRNYKDGPLDWRLIGSMEVERILRDQSFEQIDAALNHLSEAPLGSILDSNILDSGIAKYFMLSQFSVQYLIFCRKFLEETVTDLRESHNISQMEIATLKRSLSEANNEILQLHKKITQMEAIHEVIYPCHLCTKNFVSNDALNLHISRKHSGSLSKTEKKSEVFQPISKDRENDLTLINTIKLELEIKQLKERLNNAEREIKEKKSMESDAKKVQENAAVELEKSKIISVRSIGIQSNLSEIKERDDSSEGNLSTPSPNRHQQFILQEKLLELEKWREEQDRQNSEFLIEVNNKMNDICTALEMTKNQRELQVNDEIQMSTSTAEELKILMTRKVEEMGKTTAANLEYIVNKMEMNYKNKLHHLENELSMLSERYLLKKDSKSDENPIQVENPPLREAAVKNNKNGHFKFLNVKANASDCKIKENDPEMPQGDTHQPKDISVSASNNTFVKYTNVTQLEKQSSSGPMSEDDCTDLSASLLDEENLEKASETIIMNTNKKHVSKKKKPLIHKQPSAKLKIMSKKDAIKLTNCRLSSLGINAEAKTLTPFLKKRFFDDLNERRNKLKLKYPQFYATRVEIKKFVDKLCSTKMPSSAQALLKVTKRIKPTGRQNVKGDEYSFSEEEDAESLKASTPLNEKSTTDTENFKQRLQRILTSPIRKPDDNILKTVVQQENETEKLVPMLRKRVMFNQPEV